VLDSAVLFLNIIDKQRNLGSDAVGVTSAAREAWPLDQPAMARDANRV
jgi:hypothetical protein